MSHINSDNVTSTTNNVTYTITNHELVPVEQGPSCRGDAQGALAAADPSTAAAAAAALSAAVSRVLRGSGNCAAAAGGVCAVDAVLAPGAALPGLVVGVTSLLQSVVLRVPVSQQALHPWM
eukprot:gene4438-787_t